MPVRQLKGNRVTSKGNSWVFYVYEKRLDGKRHQYQSRAFATREEAEEAQVERMNKYKPYGKVGHMTFKDAYTKFYSYKEDKVRASTLKTYEKRIKYLKFFYNIEIVNLTNEDYQTWRIKINELNMKVSSKNALNKLIKAIINFLEKQYNFNLRSFYLNIEPFRDPNKLEEQKKFYTPEEYKKFISVVENLQLKCFFETLYECGLRSAEARGLTWDRIDFNKGEMFIDRQIVSKNGNYHSSDFTFAPLKTPKSCRTLYISNGLLTLLKELYEQMKSKKGFSDTWFVFGSQKPSSSAKMAYHCKKIAKLAGVKYINLHGFRHSFTSELINNNVDIATVSRFLGHSNIKTTLDTYTHNFEKNMNYISNFMDKNFHNND